MKIFSVKNPQIKIQLWDFRNEFQMTNKRKPV